MRGLVLLHRIITSLVSWQIWGAFSPPIGREFSTRNHQNAVALLASPLTLAAQIVVVLPAGLGIDEQPPLPFVAFRHSWHKKLLSGLSTEII